MKIGKHLGKLTEEFEASLTELIREHIDEFRTHELSVKRINVFIAKHDVGGTGPADYRQEPEVDIDLGVAL